MTASAIRGRLQVAATKPLLFEGRLLAHGVEIGASAFAPLCGAKRTSTMVSMREIAEDLDQAKALAHEHHILTESSASFGEGLS